MLAIVTRAQDALYDVSSTPATTLVPGTMYVLQHSQQTERALYFDSNNNSIATTADVSELLGKTSIKTRYFFTAGDDGIRLSITLKNVNDDNINWGYGDTGGGIILAPRKAPSPASFLVKDAAGQYVMLDGDNLYGINATNPGPNAKWIAYEVTRHQKHVWDDNSVCSICGQVCNHTDCIYRSEDWHQCKACGKVTEHGWEDGHCDGCNTTCSHPYWSNGACVFCDMPHEDHQYDSLGPNYHQCGTCEHVEEHDWEDGYCSACGYECSHPYWSDGACVFCGMKTSDEPIIAGEIEFGKPITVDFPRAVFDFSGDMSTPDYDPTFAPLYHFVIDEPGMVMFSAPEIDDPHYGFTIFAQDFYHEMAEFYCNEFVWELYDAGDYYLMPFAINEGDEEIEYHDVTITPSYSALGFGTLRVGNYVIDLTSEASVNAFNAAAPGKMSVNFGGRYSILTLQDCAIESDGEGGIVFDSPMNLAIVLKGENSIRRSAKSTAETFYGIKAATNYVAIDGPGSLSIDATIGLYYQHCHAEDLTLNINATIGLYCQESYAEDMTLNINATSHAIELTGQDLNYITLEDCDINLYSATGNGINCDGMLDLYDYESSLEITAPMGVAIISVDDEKPFILENSYDGSYSVWAGNSKAEAEAIAEIAVLEYDEEYDYYYTLEPSTAAVHYFSIRYRSIYDLNGDGRITVADLVKFISMGDEAPLFGMPDHKKALSAMLNLILDMGAE